MNRPSRLVPALALSAVAFAAVTASACKSENAQAAAAAPRGAAVQDDRVAVGVVSAQTGTIEEGLKLSGSLAPQSRVGIRPKLPGTLERLTVNIGDAVRAGTLIGVLDRRELDAGLDAATASVNVARAAVETAEANLANASLEHDRARNLFEKGAIPKQRLDGADTQHRAATAQRDLARASLAQAEAALRRARDTRADATLRSPIAGVIVERNVDPGALVGPGDKPVVVVADTRVLKLEAGVSEFEAGRLRVGMPAIVSVAARPDATFAGRVAAIAPQVDEKNRHFSVEIRVDNAVNGLIAGMYATARVVTRRADLAVSVPKDAVTTRGGRRVVFRVDGDTVQPVDVAEGIADERRVQITSGLKAGDVVMADGRRDLGPGARVKAVPAAQHQ